MKNHGFSLIELVSVVAVVVSVTAVLGPVLGHSRGQMRGVSSEANLAAIGQATAMYGMDHDDRIFTFTWRAGELYLNQKNGQMISYPDDQVAAARQMQDILYTATGRIRGLGSIQSSEFRLSHRRYSHLVLAEYMGGNVSDPMWADPADANLLHWQLNPLEYLEDENTVPYANGPVDFGYDEQGAADWSSDALTQKWSFSSSYQVVPHAWMQDFGDQYAPVESTPNLFTTTGNNVMLGERRLNEVRFPSAKVHIFEEYDRRLAGSPYFAYDHAAPAKLMFDGSINTAMSGLAASSVSPRDYNNGDKFVWDQIYRPLDTFPAPLGGLGEDPVLNMRYRWTLGGLSGVDYPQVIMRGSR